MSKLDELPKKYPELFQNSFYPKCKDELDFHFGCGEGWYGILDALLANVRHHLIRYRDVVKIKADVLARGETPLPWIAEYFEENPVDPLDSFTICQVKEKFGGLRFYWDCDVRNKATYAIDGAEGLAESMSYRTCEICGCPGKSGSHGGWWVKTLCPDHEMKAMDSARKRKEAREQALRHPKAPSMEDTNETTD